jgi:hypothetical protein
MAKMHDADGSSQHLRNPQGQSVQKKKMVKIFKK